MIKVVLIVILFVSIGCSSIDLEKSYPSSIELEISYPSFIDPERSYPSTLEEFLTWFENVDDKMKNRMGLYGFMLNPKGVPKEDPRVKYICDSMTSTLTESDISEAHQYIWKCDRKTLSVWLSDPDKYSYFKLEREYVGRPLWDVLSHGEGYVALNYDVNEAGQVENIRVVESNNPVLIPISIKAAQKMKYRPSYKYGLPVLERNLEMKYNYEMR